MNRVFCRLALGLVVAFGFFGCTTTPETGRHQLNLISSGEEMQLGLQSFNEVKKQTPISKDPAANTKSQSTMRNEFLRFRQASHDLAHDVADVPPSSCHHEQPRRRSCFAILCKRREEKTVR